MKRFLFNAICAVILLATPAGLTAGPMPIPAISSLKIGQTFARNLRIGPVYARFVANLSAQTTLQNLQEQEPIMANCTAESLTGEPWKISTSVFAEMLPDRPAQVTFYADGLRLDAPCNFFTTKALIGDGTLTIFPFENMPKTCGLEVMEVEGALLRAFTRAVGFSITPGGELILTAADGSELVRAAR